MSSELPPSELPTSAVPGSPPPDPAAADKSTEKRKKKVRSAWISFISRILAQFVGAAATIVLGLMVLQSYQATSTREQDATRSVTESGQSPGAAAGRLRVDDAPTSIAVLPLADFSDGPDRASVADAMTEGIIAALTTEAQQLRVISRTSSMSYKGASKPLPQIARELGVDWIVEGSVIAAGGRVRIVAQLIDAETDEHIWARDYERTFADLVSLQSGLAPIIASDLTRALLQHDRFTRRNAAFKLTRRARVTSTPR